MGARAKRLCRKCGAIATVGRYCERHKDAAKQTELSYRDPALRRLYKTKAWLQTREQVLSDNPVCQHKDQQGIQCPKLSTDVHHVIPAKKWMAQGGDLVDQSNLEALCHEHHSRLTAGEVGFAGWNKRSMRRLTGEEKRNRGTFQQSLERAPRDVATIEEEIAWTGELIEELQFSAREATASIKKLGPIIPSGRGAQNSHKPHPGLRIFAWAMGEIRRQRRQLEFLKEELERAKSTAAQPDDEFKGL